MLSLVNVGFTEPYPKVRNSTDPADSGIGFSGLYSEVIVVVACDYPHGAESGDLLALTDGDIQGLSVNTVLSSTTFTVQNNQGIRQGRLDSL